MSALDSVTGSFVPGDTSTPAEQYSYSSIVPSGVDLGSLGGIMSTGGNSGMSWDKILGYAKNLVTGKGSPADYAAAAMGLYGLMGGNKPSGSPGWRGTIDPNKYTMQRRALPRPAYVPYSGAPVMGRQNFETTYVKNAAEGGIMELARGGKAKDPRYLSGSTDGMADKLSTSIDGEEPAALSHGEFVIPADVVSHLGNGNSEAGAQQLYKMMDRIRMARTGTKKQGKRIDPEKFMAGGESGYAGGGIVSFADGGITSPTTPPVTKESNLSEWAAPGVTDYLEKGMALASQPYQAYTGPLTAGTSPLQQQAFTNASNLQVPAAMGQAQNIVKEAGQQLGNLSYSPTTAQNQYTAGQGYTAGQITNPYTSTAPYATGNFSVGDFNADAVKQYMNPYIDLALNPQLNEARRQAQITQMGNAAKATAAGAFGGSRGALMDTETQRNLGQQLAQITGQGYNTAFGNAMDMFKSQQGLGLQAQQAAENSRQFGANQALSNAQNAAQYGLAGFGANEQARQAQAQQAQQQAAARAQYGLAADQLNAQDKQFGANYGLQSLQGKLNAGTTLGSLASQEGSLGLQNLQQQAALGATQRGVEQEGIDALYKQYEQERLDPYKQIQFQQSLFNELPLSTVTNSTATSGMQDLNSLLSGIGGVYKGVNGLGG